MFDFLAEAICEGLFVVVGTILDGILCGLTSSKEGTIFTLVVLVTIAALVFLAWVSG